MLSSMHAHMYKPGNTLMIVGDPLKMYCFLCKPFPSNVFQPTDHFFQLFFDGFGVIQPLVSMVFNGQGPLVQQCDGFDGSLTSICVK